MEYCLPLQLNSISLPSSRKPAIPAKVTLFIEINSFSAGFANTEVPLRKGNPGADDSPANQCRRLYCTGIPCSYTHPIARVGGGVCDAPWCGHGNQAGNMPAIIFLHSPHRGSYQLPAK